MPSKKKTLPQKLEYSAGAVIFRFEKGEREYLMLNYGAGHWEFARGHIEGDETEMETAKREIWEETGIKTLKFIKGFRDTFTFSFQHRGNLITKEVTFFIAEVKSRQVTLSSPEHRGYTWAPYQTAKKLATFDNAKNLLTDVEEFLKLSKDKKLTWQPRRKR